MILLMHVIVIVIVIYYTVVSSLGLKGRKGKGTQKLYTIGFLERLDRTGQSHWSLFVGAHGFD